MKKLAFFVAAFALMVAASCNREPAVPDSVVIRGTEMTFTAYAEVPGTEGAGLTKTQVVNSNLVYWSPSDVLSIFRGSGSNGGNRFISSNTEVQAKADFTGVLEGMSGGSEAGAKYFWAVYPFSKENACDGVSVTLNVPGEQVATADSFDPYAFPSVARSNTTSLQFFNVCGGLVLELSDPDIESVTISGNNGEIIAGKVKVGFGTDRRPYVKEVTDGLTAVTLKPESYTLDAGVKYYVSLLPVFFSEGFCLTICKDGKASTRVFPKARTLGRSVFGSMSGFDTDLDYSPFPVDLGLGVKWASFNVGATSPENRGYYFAWGETAKKDTYTWSNYLFSGTAFPITKYNATVSFGHPDYKSVLEPSDDPATFAYGKSWRMPTREEQEELMSGCTWTWTDHDGIYGYEVSGNGNTIFLPAAGYWDGIIVSGFNASGGYWSSSLSQQDCRDAYAMSFRESGLGDKAFYNRYTGLPVRAVYSEFVPVESISFDGPDTVVMAGESCNPPVLTITPAAPTDAGLIWTSSDESVAKVASDGAVSGIAPGSATVTVYTSNGLSASFKVTVKADRVTPVDLGLSVQWAPCNLGASRPEEFGSHFAWVETMGKSNCDWSTYLYCDGASTSLGKYNFDASSGAVDYKTLLEPSDDAATAAMGLPWRMPTAAEVEELFTKTSWASVIKNGVYGYEFTARNGNSIFLPNAGFQEGEKIAGAGECGGYWTSASNGFEAYALWFQPKLTKAKTLVSRSLGLAVRPVVGGHVPVTELVPSSSSLEVTGLNFTYTPITCTVLPENATDKSLRWVSEDESIVKADALTGTITTIGPGTTVVKVYASNGVSTSITCTVHKVLTSLGQSFDYEVADLGLSVKWAARNLGASKASGYGSYFAWGENAAKSSYSWNNYKYSGGYSASVLSITDDVAMDMLGSNWRLPSKAEVEELITDCYWTPAELDGIQGFRVSAMKQGFSGSIFIPASGYKADTAEQPGNAGFYWTSDLLDGMHAIYLGFDADGGLFTGQLDCCYGLTVRPVIDK